MAALKEADYINSSAYLRVQEKKLLDRNSLERIADASNLEDALRMLSANSDYDLASLQDPTGYEEPLRRELRRVYQMASSLGDNQGLVDLAGCKYDYHNLKTALKAHYYPAARRSPLPYARVTGLEPELLEPLAAGEPADPDRVPQHLIRGAELAREAYAGEQNPQAIDLSLDRSMFAHMAALCRELDNAFLTGYVERLIDFTNLKTLLRAKNMQRGAAFLSRSLVEGGKTELSFFQEQYNKTPSAMVPSCYYRYFGESFRRGMEEYEKSGNFSGLERMLDGCLVAYTRDVKYMAYGPEILFAYLVNKENEIRQVRILLACKANGIAPDDLRERLRENYV